MQLVKIIQQQIPASNRMSRELFSCPAKKAFMEQPDRGERKKESRMLVGASSNVITTLTFHLLVYPYRHRQSPIILAPGRFQSKFFARSDPL
jgi:hypothetical protein